MREKLYYFESSNGCGIRRAKTSRGACRQVADEIGRNNIKLVRRATQKDIGWVRGFGGRIPEGN